MNFEQTKPIFRQISDLVCDEIMLGRYAVGARIPSVRVYAYNLEVNANTVARALEILQKEGIIVKDRGIGFFVAENARELIIKQRREQFDKEIMPNVFRQMYILGITPEHITKEYEKYLKGGYIEDNTQK